MVSATPKQQPTARRARNKIALVGSGQIGAMLGLLSGLKNLGDVYLFDVVPGVPFGKALDLNHLSAVEGTDCRFYGTNDSAVALKDADVVIVTAGVPRKPGMSRDDLLDINGKIIGDVAAGIRQHCSSAFVICITNPLDAMVQHLQRLAGLPTNKVCGMSGVLDSARFQHFLADKLNVSVTNISAMVIGGHGDAMVPLPRYTTVSGVNLLDLQEAGLITKQDIEEVVTRTRNAGGEIVEYLKMGSAFFAPAAAAIRMTEAYLLDRKCLLPAAAYLTGQYGYSDLYVGVPCIIGGAGVEKVVELPLSNEEKTAFAASVDSVRNLVTAMDAIAAKKTSSLPTQATDTPISA